MTGYLKRLLRVLAAYQLPDIVAKFAAVGLLPVYTHYLRPGEYGEVELLANGVIFVSIVVRFGIIEAFLRYYYTDTDPARRDALVRRAAGFLVLTTTLVAAAGAVAAHPLARLVLGPVPHATELFLIAVLGLWSFTNLELAYGLLRVDERIRTYATASLINVVITVGASVVLVVGLGLGARGLLLGNYGASTIVLLGLWWSYRHRLLVRQGSAERLPILMRFGLPTVPAEASVYALNIVDRYYIYHGHGSGHGPGAAGVYSIAVKLAGILAFTVRAFQYAWPPLAYSVTDDAEASRLYGFVTTYYVLFSGWIVAGLALEGRWVVRLLAASWGYPAYKPLPWVALGWAMYGLFVVFVVIAGRAKVTTRNFPAALLGLAANVVLLVLLVPRLGLTGAGVALCGAYLVMLTAMYFFTRRLFAVAFEWRRLAHVVVVIGAIAALGDLFLPTGGFAGFVLRALAWLVIPVALLVTRFPHREELDRLRALAQRRAQVSS
ncbi:MAG TPA: polysaccharide biosynthesis C-terminal domain-containing protein [Solirubrobacteraceae bacterium]|nr:polysaccharide biosynthesis C-terminal domain-containing protein [Solirubrobacteraceae bacterium]